jgi:hypothetical protein
MVQLALVRGVKVEVNAAERARTVVLAEDDRDVRIKRNAVAEVWPPALVGFDGFIQQGRK